MQELETALSVSQLNEIINRIFKAEEMLHNICVAGEVSGMSVSGPHAYFTLKDEKAQLQCCCFSYLKTYTPKNGEYIIATGSPDFYIKGGRLSFNVEYIRPFGLGGLYQKIEELKLRLRDKGVFDESKKAAIPRFADNICVVTSKNGAVIRDIATTVRKKNTRVSLTVCDVRVQGERAVEDICRALKNVDRLGFDIVIIARGGGSLEDLMPFYSEEVAMAVYGMRTPTISAVGHETDFSICDMAADYRAPTPTAAAEYAAYDENALKQAYAALLLRMNRQIAKTLEHKRKALVSAARALSANGKGIVSERSAELKRLTAGLVSNMNSIIQKKRSAIERLSAMLDKLSPIKRLESGYFKIERNKLPVSGVSTLKDGDRVRIFGFDGFADAGITGNPKKTKK
ncbi:MAG: exodeoxyribonuclease VII large subunit [Clostridiales bacterium]|jgi:exodeoxyribonuclease VII large subunit|nr:exodeoxyribonuclease VII large subunit [Clostridiales bacterium]